MWVVEDDKIKLACPQKNPYNTDEWRKCHGVEGEESRRCCILLWCECVGGGGVTLFPRALLDACGVYIVEEANVLQSGE